MRKRSIQRERLDIPTPVEACIDLPACTQCHALKGDPCRTPSDRTRHPHDNRVIEARYLGIKIWYEDGSRWQRILQERNARDGVKP
jgi:hypothetical protein